MIEAEVTDEAEVLAFAEDVREAAKTIALATGLAAARIQCDAIDASSAPDGSPQRQVARSTARRADKQGKPPLVRTGVLADSTQWRVEQVPNGDVTVRPPASRSKAVYAAKALGFSTIFDRLYAKIVAACAKELDAAAKRIGKRP